MLGRILYVASSLLVACCTLADGRFVIERIEVRNAVRVSPRLIVAESLLREGSEASEEDVRAAAQRLERLPFVFAAHYSLEPGSDGARRVVVIDVRENERLWGLVDARFIQEHEPFDMLDYDYPDPAAEWKHAAAGVRWLFGDGGVAHFALTVLRDRHGLRKNYSAYEVGYTRHRIAGTPFFATAIVRSPVDSLEEKTFTPKLIVGLPLTAEQTLTAEYEDTSFRDAKVRIGTATFRDLQFERTLSAAWTFDTRNDPYAATTGTFVRVEPFLFMADQTSFSFTRPPQQFVTVARHSNAAGVDASATRHWQMSDVSSLSAGVRAAWAGVRNAQNLDSSSSELRMRRSFEVISGGYARRIGRSSAELEGRVLLSQVNGTNGQGEDTDPSYEVAASWRWRNPRAALRLGIAYSTR
ncbi:MAG TPA: hypothetical protein VM733_12645 [Thermoanaerobaculia bacterium]|nr:hypothetical protein [Thermoanaerobaculia bacterium]